jgi:hypothetical protein
MQPVEHVGPEIMRGLGRLADAGDEQDLVGGMPQGDERIDDRLADGKIPATRTPCRLELAIIGYRDHKGSFGGSTGRREPPFLKKRGSLLPDPHPSPKNFDGL